MNQMINLTADISKTCACRGGVQPSLYSHEVARMYSTVSTVSFSIHNATHIDLPWLIDWIKLRDLIFDIEKTIKSNDLDLHEKEGLKRVLTSFENLNIDPNKLEVFGKEIKDKKYDFEKEYLTWIEKKCIVLDFTDKIKVIESFLSNDPLPSLFLKDDMNDTELFILFDQLKITKKDIIGKINKIRTESSQNDPLDNIKDTIIIFKTLWTERFLPYNMDINNPIFEGWHAFLTYPYLSDDAIQFLIEENVAGVASDTVSLENPLCYIDVLSDNYKKYLLNLKNIDFGIVPFHSSFLLNKKIILENLWYLTKIPSSIGTLYIFPYRLGTMDGAIANVFFNPS